MRSHTIRVALASVLALASTPAGTASADEQEFLYRYYDDQQELQAGSLVDPPEGECIEIPEVAAGTGSAFRPENWTESIAKVYDESGCAGIPSFSLRPSGQGSDLVTFRSVVFI
ncbi:hypothetical protein SD37_33430 [Amycolatopsis orientalis]|uniref:Uncharacterized protein n=1 Tax=Amycolatopsis orientalis TaxID=31958 RepID=A0A193C6C3_AMYOR|nr:hypothetical protein [Amycolatopsis orientalis]ANN20027.1 hypothetical protein SD37_33430 [Amycolatopsis orientalis]